MNENTDKNDQNTGKLIKSCNISVGRKVDVKLNQRRRNAVKEIWWKKEEYKNQYKFFL